MQKVIVIVMSHDFFVLAHNIRSLHNVGSIFRTCDVFAVSKLFLSGYTGHPSRNPQGGHEYNLMGHPPDNKISKVSLGAEETVPWEFNKSAIRIINKLKKEYPKLKVVGLENNITLPNLPYPDVRYSRGSDRSVGGGGSSAVSPPKIGGVRGGINLDTKFYQLPTFKPKFPVLLVLGEEVSGISKPLLKLCDAFVEIPQYGQKESLNVSVAFGIAAYEISIG